MNRIDELEKPSAQVKEIRASLQKTLTQHGVRSGADIVFGSAKWAEAALYNNLALLSSGSIAALMDWAEIADFPFTDDAATMAWHMSGVPNLVSSIGTRVLDGAARRILQKARKQLRSTVVQTSAGLLSQRNALLMPTNVGLTVPEIKSRAFIASRTLRAELDRETRTLSIELRRRMDAATSAFVETTVAAMVQHISANGASGNWECDTLRLRMMLRAAYMSFASSTRAVSLVVLGKAVKEVQALYGEMLGEAGAELTLESPIAPKVPPPVALGKTIVLDLQGGWWSRWIKKRRGAEAFGAQYRALIIAETDSIVKEIQEVQVNEVNEALRLSLYDFFEDHVEAMEAMARAGTGDKADLLAVFGATDQEARLAELDAAMRALDLDPVTTLPNSAIRGAA